MTGSVCLRTRAERRLQREQAEMILQFAAEHGIRFVTTMPSPGSGTTDLEGLRGLELLHRPGQAWTFAKGNSRRHLTQHAQLDYTEIPEEWRCEGTAVWSAAACHSDHRAVFADFRRPRGRWQHARAGMPLAGWQPRTVTARQEF